jgi:hypothetical protein
MNIYNLNISTTESHVYFYANLVIKDCVRLTPTLHIITGTALLQSDLKKSGLTMVCLKWMEKFGLAWFGTAWTAIGRLFSSIVLALAYVIYELVIAFEDT